MNYTYAPLQRREQYGGVVKNLYLSKHPDYFETVASELQDEF
jgi:hypothetical protein